MSPNRRSRLAGWIWSSEIWVLPMMHSRAISAWIACDGSIPEVRCAPACSISSGNRATLLLGALDVDIFKIRVFFDGFRNEACHFGQFSFIAGIPIWLESVFTLTSTQFGVKTGNRSLLPSLGGVVR